jgi:hypothetical protein
VGQEIASHGDFRAAASLRSVRIYEERGKSFHKIMDFDEQAVKDDGPFFGGRWSGESVTKNDKIVCDPVREKLYFANKKIFDLGTGHYEGTFALGVASREVDDIAVDKRGYIHLHFNPGAFAKGVGRVSPSRARPGREGTAVYPEVPYDYGVPLKKTGSNTWQGVLPTKCQPGSHWFQTGIGVTMSGDVAIQSYIFYVPKMEEYGLGMYLESVRASGTKRGRSMSYATYMTRIKEMEKKGEKVYFIRREAGIPLAGSTAWTYDRTGELRQECAMIAGDDINGMMIDEDGALYTVAARPKAFGGRSFLAGRGGTFGVPDDEKNRNPFTGTLIKTKPGVRCKLLLAKAIVPMDSLPERAPDVLAASFPPGGRIPDKPGKKMWAWVEGSEWLYAGASPIVAGGCKCPMQRLHTDWYKRTYVPEAYRHSIGIVDTAGNLIMHLGKYGNFDSANGAKSKDPVGGDNIAMFQPRAVSGTDNYLAYGGWGERLTVLKLNYHAEETVSIREEQ